MVIPLYIQYFTKYLLFTIHCAVPNVNAVLKLDHCLRRWSNIKLVLAQRLLGSFVMLFE